MPPGEDERRRVLIRASRRGDRGARERLVASHLGLIRSVAWRYRGLGLPLDDLVQEGALGLLDAIDRYDALHGPDFDGFARFRIRRAIRGALTEQARLIRLPKHVIERRRGLDRAEARLTATGGRPPTPAQLAAAAGLSVEAVLEARSLDLPPVSLDAPVLPDGSSLASMVADPAATGPEREALAYERAELLSAALDRLPERQRQIVDHSWGLSGPAGSSSKLAAELELSPRRTQTLGRDALHELRATLEPLRTPDRVQARTPTREGGTP